MTALTPPWVLLMPITPIPTMENPSVVLTEVTWGFSQIRQLRWTAEGVGQTGRIRVEVWDNSELEWGEVWSTPWRTITPDYDGPFLWDTLPSWRAVLCDAVIKAGTILGVPEGAVSLFDGAVMSE